MNAVSIDLTWILTVLGVIVGGGVFPVALVLLWCRMSWAATVVSPWAGLACGLTAWLVVTKRRSGEITVHTTGESLNAIAGNVTSIMVGLLLAVMLSFVFPAKYSTSDPEAVSRDAKIKGIIVSEGEPSDIREFSNVQSDETMEKQIVTEPSDAGQLESQITRDNEAVRMTSTAAHNELTSQADRRYLIEPMEPKLVRKATRLAISVNAAFILVAVILVPYTLFGSSWVFSRAGFKAWCIVSFIWVWVGLFICVFWPLYESRSSMAKVLKGVVAEFGK